MNIASASERRRAYAGPALFSYGFRPFFLFGALYAGLALPLWLAILLYGVELPGAITAVDWHVHEMIFGYLAAIIAGFILTAIPNWTGRMPVLGVPLALLFFCWLAGRAVTALIASPWIVLAADSAFLILLSGAIWREVLVGGNWSNAPVCVLISLIAAANILFHLGLQFDAVAGYGTRLALGVTALLIGMVGGRIIPSFTRNWMARLHIEPLPAPFGRFDKAALLFAAVAIGSWVIAPDSRSTGVLLALAGFLHGVRLFRWRGGRTLRAPIVAILHVGYGWLAVAFILMGLSILMPGFVDHSSALHALTAGAIGTMTLAVMTRASLGHSGRDIKAGPATLAIYLLVNAGATIRSSAAYVPMDYTTALAIGGALWAAAFLLFFAAYAPLLLQSRQE